LAKGNFDEKKPSACYCLNMRRASHSITEYYNNILAPCNINLNQFSLLKNVKRMEPVNVSDLAKALRLDRTTMVRNIKVLEENEYITDISHNGSRNRQLQLTEKGNNVLNESMILWNKAQDNILEYLGEENINILTNLLSKIENL
jgi:DNA-binding MarR family transcriptional regulator